MVVVQKDIRKTTVVFYNPKFHPKVKIYCEVTDESYNANINEDGLSVFELPESDVRQKLKNRSDRWKLYGKDTKPLDVQTETPTGALKWVTFYPWVYSKKSFEIGRHDNGEAIRSTKLVWEELSPKETLSDVVENKKKQ